MGVHTLSIKKKTNNPQNVFHSLELLPLIQKVTGQF